MRGWFFTRFQSVRNNLLVTDGLRRIDFLPACPKIIIAYNLFIHTQFVSYSLRSFDDSVLSTLTRTTDSGVTVLWKQKTPAWPHRFLLHMRRNSSFSLGGGGIDGGIDHEGGGEVENDSISHFCRSPSGGTVPAVETAGLSAVTSPCPSNKGCGWRWCYTTGCS